MNDSAKSAMAEVGLYVIATPFALAYVGICSIWQAFVLVRLWSWFAVPLGAPQIGVAWMCGLSFMLRSVTYQAQNAKDERSNFEKWAVPLLSPLVLWGAGAIAHAFMR